MSSQNNRLLSRPWWLFFVPVFPNASAVRLENLRKHNNFSEHAVSSQTNCHLCRPWWRGTGALDMFNRWDMIYDGLPKTDRVSCCCHGCRLLLEEGQTWPNCGFCLNLSSCNCGTFAKLEKKTLNFSEHSLSSQNNCNLGCPWWCAGALDTFNRWYIIHAGLPKTDTVSCCCQGCCEEGRKWQNRATENRQGRVVVARVAGCFLRGNQNV